MRAPAILLLGLFFASTAIVADEQEPASPESVPETFSELDVDGNGLISYAEAEVSSDIAMKFAVADENDDGVLSSDEFAGLLMASQE